MQPGGAEPGRLAFQCPHDRPAQAAAPRHRDGAQQQVQPVAKPDGEVLTGFVTPRAGIHRTDRNGWDGCSGTGGRTGRKPFTGRDVGKARAAALT